EQEVALVPGPGRVVAAGERQPDRELRTAHEVFRRAQRGAGGQVGDLPFARQPDPADPVGRPRGHDPRNGPDLVCQPARRTLHSHPPQSLRKTTLHANRKVLHVRPIDTLVRSLPEGRVVTDPDVIDSYARDRTFVEPGKPLGAVLARSRDDVVTTLRWASEHRVPVVPRGAGTGLAGGATAGDGALARRRGGRARGGGRAAAAGRAAGRGGRGGGGPRAAAGRAARPGAAGARRARGRARRPPTTSAPGPTGITI